MSECTRTEQPVYYRPLN